MCGIAGVHAYHYAARPVETDELCVMRDRMAARGPDGAGFWRSDDGRIGLANRRLAIIDLSERGQQPMRSADGRLAITYNGEIYNYRELRRRLEARGYVCRSGTDTEILLHLYAWKGAKMLDELRGMFAFALWDEARGGLLLVRDPYGIKPLYYADDGWTFRFASQVKALVAAAGVSRDPEPAGWAGFFLFGSVPEPFTTYREIRSLPAGSSMWVDRRGPHAPIRFCDVAALLSAPAEASAAGRDLHDRLHAALLDSVEHHLVGDVPIGLFLSSGVDSGALLGLVGETSRTVHTITLAYEEFRGEARCEADEAGRLAALHGVRHTRRTVSEAEFLSDLPLLLDAMDQPSIDGVNVWFASKAARELGLKVALAGVGGDELFGGYPSFTDIPRWVQLMALPSRVPLLGEAVRLAISGLRRAWPAIPPKAAGFVRYAGSYAGAYLLRRGVFLPDELHDVMAAAAEGLQRLDPLRLIAAAAPPGAASPAAKVAALEAGLYLRNQLLRDTDWAGMAHSVEVRVPLVDVALTRAVAPDLMALAPGEGKRLLAAAPRMRRRPHLIDRAKRGFETPIAQWLQRDPGLQAWRRSAKLRTPTCPWARRWAYQLAAA
jgi:asparagine synthase (glutamine-hydrolysing)